MWVFQYFFHVHGNVARLRLLKVAPIKRAFHDGCSLDEIASTKKKMQANWVHLEKIKSSISPCTMTAFEIKEEKDESKNGQLRAS